MMNINNPLEPTRDTDNHEQQKLAKKIKNFIYDPTDVIGSGFSSKVYKGINQLTNEQVAIKVIELSKIQNEVQKYLLNNEINALRALNQKNILKTIDILMTKNNVYIVTEFCQFGDLQQMIKNNKTLNEKDAINITRDIVEGYLAVEQKNIIHRDLKTANIFLTKTGAKIADFGFCQFIGEKKPQIAYNVGSPAYMSPQSYKQNVYSNKSDIWGIGIMLIQMLTGQTPDKTLTYSQMSNNLMNGKINCGSNEQVKLILSRCFKRDTNQRIDCQSLLQALNNQLARLGGKNQSGGNSRFSNSQNKFGKGNFSSQFTPNQTRLANKVFSSNLDNLRSSTDDKQFMNFSPSKLRNNNEDNSRQITIQGVQQSQLNAQGSPIIKPTKYQGVINSSGFHQKIINSPNSGSAKIIQTSEVSSKIKSNITMLQYIFRLFKYLSQVSITTSPFLKLMLFRHRSHVDQTTQNLLQQFKIPKQSSQLYRQFQYLKMKFDETYLQKQGNSHLQSNHQLMNLMNQFANISFTDKQSLKTYQKLLKRGCEQVQNQINENRSNAYIVWDYLLLEYQLLGLYSEGFSDQTIVNEKILLQQILKQQQRNLGKSHIQLLKIKTQLLFSGQNSISSNSNQGVSRPNFIKF